MNIGLMKVGKVFVPITILISKPSDKEIYLEDTIYKEVEKLEIIDNNEEAFEISTDDIEEIELNESF